MSNLNIQQKVSLAAQKNKETKEKDASLTPEQLRLKEFEEQTKPNFSEEHSALFEKYKTKLTPLGFQEIAIYDLIKKYDWNEVILDDIARVQIQRKMDAGDFDGWKEVKRVAKPQVTRKAKEAEDVRRPRRYGGDNANTNEDFGDRFDNYRGGRSFKERALRGQSVDAGRRGGEQQGGGRRGKYHNDFYHDNRNYEGEHNREGGRYYNKGRDYNWEEGYGGDRFDNRQGRRDFGNRGKAIVTYVKKGEQEPEQSHKDAPEHQEHHEHKDREHRELREHREHRENREHREHKENKEQREQKEPRENPRKQKQNEVQNFKKHTSEEQYGRKGRFERVIYVKKTQSQNPEEHGVTDTHKVKSGKKEPREPRERVLEETEHTWKNEEDDVQPTKGNKEETQKRSTAPSQTAQTDSPSPNKGHYNEHNIHEFFKSNAGGLTDSAKKETKKEVVTEKPKASVLPTTTTQESKPSTIPRVESDHTSQTAQKPQLEHPSKPKEKPQIQQTQSQPQPEIHDKPIGPNRTQNVPHSAHASHATTHTATTHSSHPTHQGHVTAHGTHQSHHTHPNAQSTQNVQQQAAENQQFYQQQPFGYPGYVQQQYMMPQYPQQGFFNPYMQMYGFQQMQPQQFDSKDQPQGSYPPGFNPQDMASMYQMPMILIPQPNGTTLLQPLYQMMPQTTTQGQGGQSKSGEGEQQQQQQKFTQQNYQFPMAIPTGYPDYYSGHNENKQKHGGHHDNTGSFFNFSSQNEGDYKKQQQGGHGHQQQHQGAGFPFMPYVMPTNLTQGQHHQGKNLENQGGHSWK